MTGGAQLTDGSTTNEVKMTFNSILSTLQPNKEPFHPNMRWIQPNPKTGLEPTHLVWSQNQTYAKLRARGV